MLIRCPRCGALTPGVELTLGARSACCGACFQRDSNHRLLKTTTPNKPRKPRKKVKP
jgi:hypothetical protein